MSSERELRKTMVTSLEHVATFAALIGKAYTLTGTAEDKAARELLSQTIKADFTFLSQKIDETSVEVNWSRYSMQGLSLVIRFCRSDYRLDYQLLTDRIRQLQRTLITAHISLLRFDEQDIEIFRDDILPPTKLAFTRLRRDIDLTIREIGAALGCGPMYIEVTQTGYLECLDQQRAAAAAGGTHALQQHASAKAAKSATEKRGNHGEQDQEDEGSELDGDNIAENLMDVTRRLQAEMGTETPFRTEETRPGTPSQVHPATPTVVGSTAIGTAGTAKDKGSPISPKSPLPKQEATRLPGTTGPDAAKKSKYGPHMIKQHFDEFEAAQKGVLVEQLTSTDLGEDSLLKLHEPGPSIGDLYGGDFLRGDVEEGDLPFLTPSKKTSVKTSKPNTRPSSIHQTEQESEERDEEEERDGDEDSSIGPTSQFLRNQTLVRVYSLLFAWE